MLVIYIVGLIGLVILNVVLSPDEPNWFLILLLFAWVLLPCYIH